MNRIVALEILDNLAPDDPRAIRSRKDLQLINYLMQGKSWILKTLRSLDFECVVELGAGDERLLNHLKGGYPECEVIGVDQVKRPLALREDVLWLETDVMKLPELPQGAVILSNLFLHHFESASLLEIGAKCKGARAIVCAEPHRSFMAKSLGQCLSPFMGSVTRHDMRVSIKAGFQKGELPQLFGDFRWQEEVSFLGGIRAKGVRV